MWAQLRIIFPSDLIAILKLLSKKHSSWLFWGCWAMWIFLGWCGLLHISLLNNLNHFSFSCQLYKNKWKYFIQYNKTVIILASAPKQYSSWLLFAFVELAINQGHFTKLLVNDKFSAIWLIIVLVKCYINQRAGIKMLIP